MNNSSLDTAFLVQKANDEKVKILLPVIAYIAVLMVTGLVGNLMVCFYYGFKTKTAPSSIFIVTVAVYDLIFCSISMPTEITDIALFYTFENGPACKILRTINYTASIASVLTLVTIAIDRFRLIRRATSTQMTVRDAKKYCIIVAGAAILVSRPIIVLINSEQVPVPNEFGLVLEGYDCTFVRAKSYEPYVWTFNLILVVGFFVCTSVLAVLYGMVAWTIYKHRQRLSKYTINTPQTSETQTASSENSDSRHSKTDAKPANVDNRNRDTVRVTMLMLAVTIVFVISFLPFLSLKMYRSVTGEYEGNLDNARLIAFEILSRSFLLNSSINPWIYGAFNSSFRLCWLCFLYCCRNAIKVANSLDPHDTASYSASHLDPNCLQIFPHCCKNNTFGCYFRH